MPIALLKSKILAQPNSDQLITNPQQVKKQYRYWRIRTMYSLMIGYAAFYIVRFNFSMAMPSFLKDFNLTTGDLGLILSLFSLIYGVGKFLNGILADHANPQYFMAIGLAASGIVSILLGFSVGIVTISFLWLLNAWFQSMGWPPCARSMTKWYPPNKRGLMWGIWNSSHQIGGIISLVIAGYLIQHFGWRAAFIVPGIFVIMLVPVLINRLRDTPLSLGLPCLTQYNAEAYAGVSHIETSTDSVKTLFSEHIIHNKYLWYLCFANFFVYIIRIGILTWAPLFLLQHKDINLVNAGWSTAAFEFAGIFGGLLAGYLSDTVFRGRRGPINLFFSIVLVLGLACLYWLPEGNFIYAALILAVIGFMVYGPQMLVGVAAADVSTANASATATGLTGTFGYLGSTVCSILIGLIVGFWGWDAGLLFFIVSGIIASCLFLLTWHARAL